MHAFRATVGDVEKLFAATVQAALVRMNVDSEGLHAEEAVAVEKATLSRRKEFAAGRSCARRALKKWGIVDAALPVDAMRRPVWPNDFVGSIAHTKELCVAVATKKLHAIAIGVDIEIIQPFPPASISIICGRDELYACSRALRGMSIDAPLVIFSAKEAFYKCYSVATDAYIDFHDVRLRIDSAEHAGGTFSFEVTEKSGRSRGLEARIFGGWAIYEGHIVTGVTLLSELGRD